MNLNTLKNVMVLVCIVAVAIFVIFAWGLGVMWASGSNKAAQTETEQAPTGIEVKNVFSLDERGQAGILIIEDHDHSNVCYVIVGDTYAVDCVKR